MMDRRVQGGISQPTDDPTQRHTANCAERRLALRPSVPPGLAHRIATALREIPAA